MSKNTTKKKKFNIREKDGRREKAGKKLIFTCYPPLRSESPKILCRELELHKVNESF